MVNVNYLTDEPGLFGIFTPENFALLESGGPRPADLELSPRPAASSARGSDLAAPDVEFHFAAAPFFDEGLTRAARQRLRVRPGRHQADVARQGDAAHADARLEADGAVQLPHHRRGSRER